MLVFIFFIIPFLKIIRSISSLSKDLNILILPSTIGGITINFEGLQVKTTPKKDILQVLIKLAKVAKSVRKLKPKNPNMTYIGDSMIVEFI